MRTVMAFGQEEHETLQGQEAEAPGRLTTTLYDLVAVIQAVVGPDDTQVVRTVVHLLRSGQLPFVGDDKAFDRLVDRNQKLTQCKGNFKPRVDCYVASLVVDDEGDITIGSFGWNTCYQ